ncbi:MAG: hypothetical protein HY652_11910 [Acidobacteria bacterium]|nr:hypothetical protein [Acidobacteriota bacterium]
MSSLLLVGVGLISLSVLVLEISLTRIFSVIHYYHFSFLAISIVLFGSGAGGVYVYSTASRSSQPAPRRLVWMTTWFSLATFATLFLYFRLGPQIAIYPSLISSGEWASVGMISGIYLSMAVPFFFAGAALSLALKLNPERVSRLYCADLVGAGLGCLAVIGLMQWLGAPRTAAASAVVSMVAAFLFRLSAPGEGRRTRSLPWAALALLLLAASVPSGLWRITHAKGRSENPLVFEGWNTYSRVTVSQAVEDPFGWAMSDRRPRGKVSQLMMLIDSAAGTPVVHFDGDLSKVEFLKFDVTAMAHYVRPNARILVIGAGGGRDVLAALVFQQNSVDAVEINSLVARVLGERFRDFAGHLLEHPRVRFYVEDGRNFVRRSPTSYDLIQLSLVDTWAASAAGALALTENTLYTQEAMEDYLDHLTEEGILSISRWYYVPRPSEVLRLVTTALEALGRKGVVSPEACLALVRSLPPESSRWAVGNLLVKRSPFTGEELDRLEATSNDLQFDLAYPPRSEASPEILELVRQPDAFIRDYPLDLSPPTDDRPFFFNMSRWRNLATPPQGGTLQANLDTNRLLAGLLGVSFLAVLAAILGPLW